MIVHRAVSLRMGAWGMCVSLCLHTHREVRKVICTTLLIVFKTLDSWLTLVTLIFSSLFINKMSVYYFLKYVL